MCAEVNQRDFVTIHHEMGHIEYFMQYRHQPTIYQGGGNAAFHEAIGDTIALSVLTPQHLNTVGLVAGHPEQNSEHCLEERGDGRPDCSEANSECTRN